MKKKSCAADGVRTYEDFGEAGVIRKCYIFSTKPSRYPRNSANTNTKPRNTAPYSKKFLSPCTMVHFTELRLYFKPFQ